MGKKEIYNNWNLWALIWLVVNLLQSYFTQLIDDEAYYWVFSNQLSFGYFDHPPMVAFFVKIGYSIFENELGVRLLTVFSQVVLLRIIWSFIEYVDKEKYVWLFFMIAFSIPIFQVYSFIVTPDAPLLLFSALVLWAYRAYLKLPSFLNILLFGITAAALMYSKYHGAFLIIAIIISNLKLLKQYQFYLVGIIASLLFLPHMLWQLEHDFISFQYHLFDRVKSHSVRFIFENLFNQFLIYNPFLWFVFVPALVFHWKKTIKSNLETPEIKFQKTLMFVFLTFSGLCLLFSLRLQRIEPHWTVVFVIPLIVFTFQFLAQINQQKQLKYFKYISVFTLIIFLVVRVFFIGGKSLLSGSTYMAKTEVQELEKLANGKPIIMLNSYQYSSLLAFYGQNKTAYGVNTLHGTRKNQFNVWDNTSILNGEEVLFVDKGSESVLNDTILLSSGKQMSYGFFDNYLNIQKVKFETNEVNNTTYQIGDTVILSCKLTNPYSYDLPMNRFWAYWSYANYSIPSKLVGQPKIVKGNSEEQFQIEFIVPDRVGIFECKWILGLEDYNLLKYVTEPIIVEIKK